MYSGHILSVEELITGMQIQASQQKTHEAFKILEDIYEQRQVIRSEQDSKADQDSLKAIQEICDKTLTGRFVLPLPAGAGKTTLIVAWCTYIHRSGADYSVAVASLQVGACFALRQQLLDQGIPEEDIGILYSDKGVKMAEFKAICPSTTTPSKHRFLLVTHARLEEKNHRHSRLDYKGEERSIIFYDEQFRPRADFNFDIQSLRQDIAGFVAVADDLNIREVGTDEISTIKKLLNDVWQSLEDHMGCKAEPKALIILKYDWTDVQKKSVLKTARSLLKRKNLTKDTVMFVEHVIHGGHMFLKDTKVYSHMNTIPEEIQQILVLDASYKYSKLSQLDKELRLLPIDSPRDYRNLKVIYMDCPSGKYSTTRMLEIPKERADLMVRVAEYLQEIPENEAVLFFTFKSDDKNKFESIIRRELSQLGFNMDERITTKDGRHKPKYAFLTWGQQNGTNDYMYCRHMCTIGVLDLGTDNIIAQAVAQTEGRYLFDDEAPSVHELNVSDCAQRIYQAMCRTAIRKHGHNDPCTAALFLNRNALDCIRILKDALPKARFVKADPVFKTHETNTDRVLKDVVKFLEVLSNDVTTISTKNMFKALETNYGTPITRAVKTLVMRRLKTMSCQELCWWKHEGRTLKRTLLFL